MDECEEGEIVDFDENDDEIYHPLERPVNNEPGVQLQKSVVMESESEDDEPSSSSDSDSSTGPSAVKMRKTHKSKPKPSLSKKEMKHSAEQTSQSNKKKYNIWTVGLQEEALADELQNFDALESGTRDRGVESYILKRQAKEELIDEDEDPFQNVDFQKDPRPSFKRRYNDRNFAKRRPTKLADNDLRRKLKPVYLLELSKTVDDDGDDVGRDIANKLLEDKEDLILRVVETAGKQKAISLFEETKRIESQGGMLIKTGARRRSPGGVYLFLVKHDDVITEEQKKIIFKEDTVFFQKEAKKMKNHQLKKRMAEERKLLEPELATELPALLTRGDLIMQKLKKGGDGSVSNPPPSPATDNRGESSNDSPPHRPQPDVHSRTVTDYESDFLDVYCDEMDEL